MNPPIRPDIPDPNAKPGSGHKAESSSLNVRPDPNLLPPEPEHTTPEPAALRIANAVPPKKTTTTNLTRASVFETGMGTGSGMGPGTPNPAQGIGNESPAKKITVTDSDRASVFTNLAQGFSNAAAQKNPTSNPPQRITGVHAAQKNPTPTPASKITGVQPAPNIAPPAKKISGGYITQKTASANDFGTLPQKATPALTGISIKAKSELPTHQAPTRESKTKTPPPLTAHEGGGEVFDGDIEQLSLAAHGRLPWSVGASRLVSLDLFRGITIAAMLLVNDPGSWSHIYPPLDHAEWNGWTHTDLIFPFFLFIVGVSMAFSFNARLARGDSRGRLALHTLRRAVIIYAIGFFLAMFPYLDMAHLQHIRIMGVLARIALCYAVAGMIYLFAGKVVRALAIVAALAGYWAAMMFVWVPGSGAGNLTPDGNLAAYIDRALMLGHLWKPTWDPEGLLSSIPAVATVLIGGFVGELLMPNREVSATLGFAKQTTWRRKVLWLVIGGIFGIVAGYAWNPYFPINKNLWTSSYVLFTAGYAMLALAACYWVVDVRRWRPALLTKPFLALGTNAILAFSLSVFIAKNLLIYKMTVPLSPNLGSSGAVRVVNAWSWIYLNWFAPLFAGLPAPLNDPRNASLLFALVFVAIVTMIMWVFYKRKIFLKV